MKDDGLPPMHSTHKWIDSNFITPEFQYERMVELLTKDMELVCRGDGRTEARTALRELLQRNDVSLLRLIKAANRCGLRVEFRLRREVV